MLHNIWIDTTDISWGLPQPLPFTVILLFTATFRHSPLLCYNLCTEGENRHKASLLRPYSKEQTKCESLKGLLNPSSDSRLAVEHRPCPPPCTWTWELHHGTLVILTYWYVNKTHCEKRVFDETFERVSPWYCIVHLAIANLSYPYYLIPFVFKIWGHVFCCSTFVGVMKYLAKDHRHI